MTTFDRYESVGQISGGAISSILSARPSGGGEDRFAVKVCRPPALMGVEQSDRQIRRFLEQVNTQKAAASAGGRHWAPVHAVDRLEDGAFYVTDRYDMHLGQLIEGRVQTDESALHAMLTAVVRGLVELSDAAGRPHGNLKPTNILMNRSARRRDSGVVLTDPLSAEELQPDRDWREDLRAVGKLLYELVERRDWTGPLAWPAEPGDAWSALGPNGEKWREHCNALLAPDPAKSVRSLDELVERLASIKVRKRSRKPVWLTLLVLVIVAASVAGYFVLQKNGAVVVVRDNGDGPEESGPNPEIWNDLCDEATSEVSSGFSILWDIAERNGDDDVYRACTQAGDELGEEYVKLGNLMSDINAAIKDDGLEYDPQEYRESGTRAEHLKVLEGKTKPDEIDEEEWAELDWKRLARAHGLVVRSRENLRNLKKWLLAQVEELRADDLTVLGDPLAALVPDTTHDVDRDDHDDLRHLADNLSDLVDLERSYVVIRNRIDEITEYREKLTGSDAILALYSFLPLYPSDESVDGGLTPAQFVESLQELAALGKELRDIAYDEQNPIDWDDFRSIADVYVRHYENAEQAGIDSVAARNPLSDPDQVRLLYSEKEIKEVLVSWKNESPNWLSSGGVDPRGSRPEFESRLNSLSAGISRLGRITDSGADHDDVISLQEAADGLKGEFDELFRLRRVPNNEWPRYEQWSADLRFRIDGLIGRIPEYELELTEEQRGIIAAAKTDWLGRPDEIEVTSEAIRTAYRAWVAQVVKEDDFRDRKPDRENAETGLETLEARLADEKAVAFDNHTTAFGTAGLQAAAATRCDGVAQDILEDYAGRLHELIGYDHDRPDGPWRGYQAWVESVSDALADFHVLEEKLDAGFGSREPLDVTVNLELDRVTVDNLIAGWEANQQVYSDIKTSVKVRVLDRVEVLKAAETAPGRDLGEWTQDVIRGEYDERPEVVIAIWNRFVSPDGPKAAGDVNNLDRDSRLFSKIDAVIGDRQFPRREEFADDLKEDRKNRWLDHAYAESSRLADLAHSNTTGFDAVRNYADDFGMDLTGDDLNEHSILTYNLRLAEFLGQVDGALAQPNPNAAEVMGPLKDRMRTLAGDLGRLDVSTSARSSRKGGLLEALEALLDEEMIDTLDPERVGPAASRLTGWSLQEKSDDNEYRPAWLRYRWESGRYEHELAFRLIEPEDPNQTEVTYLCVDEVSVGLFIDLIDAARAWQDIPSRMTQKPDGVRVWYWDERRKRMTLARKWLRKRGDLTEQEFPSDYYPGSVPHRPSRLHPMSRVSPNAAMFVASLVDCRLPTVGEWRRANDSPSANEDLPNRRDPAWEHLHNHLKERRKALTDDGFSPRAGNYTWPDREIFWPGQKICLRPLREPEVGSNAKKAVSTPDSIIWFRETDARDPSAIRNLIGNVHEFVLRNHETLRSSPEAPASIGSFEGFAMQSPSPIVVIGESALSPPADRLIDQPQEIGRSLDDQGQPTGDFCRRTFADVGFRLAFSANAPERQSFADKVRDLLFDQGELKNFYLPGDGSY